MLISKKTTMEVFIQDKIPQALILFFFINSFLLFKERLSLTSVIKDKQQSIIPVIHSYKGITDTFSYSTYNYTTPPL